MNALVIEHNTDLHCFVVESQGLFAKLEYSLDDNEVTFTSTYVPFRLRGKGLAEALVDTGLQWAKDQQFSIASTCWYVDRFMDQ